MSPQVSRPRKSRAIFAAALDRLARDGYDDLTMEGVAADAGVNKTTLYRSWPSKDALVAAALLEAPALELTIPDTGGLRGDLLELATQLVDLLTQERTRGVVSALLSPAHRKATSEAARSFFADRLGQERVIFERAVRRGELPADVDPRLAMDLLGGALWFHLLIRRDPTADLDAPELVDTVLRGIGASEVLAGP